MSYLNLREQQRARTCGQESVGDLFNYCQLRSRTAKSCSQDKARTSIFMVSGLPTLPTVSDPKCPLCRTTLCCLSHNYENETVTGLLMTSSEARIEETSWPVISWAVALAQASATCWPSPGTTNAAGVKKCGHNSDRQ